MNISRRIAVVFLAFLVTWLAAVAEASPEERAQLFKREVRKQFMADDWTLLHDRPSGLVLEKPLTDGTASLVQALMTGPKGTRPVFRWTFTFTAISEHATGHRAQASLTSRDASGKAKTISISTAPANKAYIDAKLRAANAAMPAKYKQ